MTAPVRREILVDAAPARAFELFTEHLGAWWPLERHGVFHDGTVALEDQRIVERSGALEAVWGTVTVWSPPDELGFTWHPGYSADEATNIRVTFTALDDQTLVTLVHSGWERMAGPDSAAEEYGNGWPLVLARFGELVAEVPRASGRALSNRRTRV
jgi:hypothetical protein